MPRSTNPATSRAIVTHPLIPMTLIALAAPAAIAPIGEEAVEGSLFAQLTIHERIIVRVPRMSGSLAVGRTALPVQTVWKEKKGPKCVAATDLGGAMVSAPGSVDLILVSGKRLRAKLDHDCGALAYYSGFYLRPASDGQLCAQRDVIRVRSGASCGIAGFKTLVVAR